jgi:predicted transcriptional regulator
VECVDKLADFDVREFRLKVGISQDELARITGIPVRSIVRWETGEAHPRVVSLKHLLHRLSEELLGSSRSPGSH